MASTILTQDSIFDMVDRGEITPEQGAQMYEQYVSPEPAAPMEITGVEGAPVATATPVPVAIPGPSAPVGAQPMVAAEGFAQPPQLPAGGQAFNPQPGTARAAPVFANPMAGTIRQLGRRQQQFEKEVGAAGKLQGQSLERQLDAAAMASDAKRAYHEEEADILAGAQQRQAELEADRAEAERFRTEEMGKAEGELNDVLQDFRSKKVDPERLYSRARRVQITNSIALAFGSIAQGKYAAIGIGGPNPLEAVAKRRMQTENQIQRDIEAQRGEIAKLKTLAGVKQNGLGLMRQRFGDERAAESALKVAMWDDVETQMKQRLAQSSIGAQDAGVVQMMGIIEEKKAENAMNLAGVTNENAQRTIAAQGAARAQGMALAAKAKVAAEGMPPPSPGIRWIDQRYANKENRKEIAKIMSKHAPLEASLRDMIQFREQHGFEIADRDVVRAGAVKMTALKNMIRNAAEAGANFPEEEQRLVFGPLPDNPTDLARVLVTLQGFLEEANRGTSEKIRAFGGQSIGPRASTRGGPAL